MRPIRLLAASLALAALASSPSALADKGKGKGKGKGWKKKGTPHAWVNPSDRRLQRDLARLVAARPRLPDGSRIVINAPRGVAPAAPRTSASPRYAAAPRHAAAPRPGADAGAVQRRMSAVDSYLRTHRPPALPPSP